ncbi:YeeE/YedE family protein [Halioglobus maricola]|uniref:YeeE/YedE family protein n=1 Tax=Halioglobus maricola TaxID=2601894 RepID=A0A5P9NL41_9GAMM|nr:YeeE/YedE thiosulfate transporter family protein [Halioglobus maricola]QFU76329.1 YeeE/YedE family protein [Halioglobus maricola]
MMTFATPLAGGILIGVAASLLLYLLGRIAGISGILWGAISASSDNAWRWMFLLGLLGGALVYHLVLGVPFPRASEAPAWLAIVAGLLVGVGTRLGSGCTSGHGVCGLGRLSLRSLVATLTFMAAGIATVYVFRQLLGVI